jgi:hypothetical protein
MKLQLNINYTNGESASYMAHPPEFAKWEQKTGFIISQAQEKIGISDLLFLSYHAMKREAAGKPVKPFEVWCETVTEVSVGETIDPKATQSEA